jgi:hypothetical protein
LRQPKTALLQPINHGFYALLRQNKAALLQPINHGFWRPLAPLPDCPLAAGKPRCWRPPAPPQGCPLAIYKPHHNAHLRRYRTALLRSETNLQTPLSCPVNGLPSCNSKAHHPRLQTSYLLAPSCTKLPPICGRLRAALLLTKSAHTHLQQRLQTPLTTLSTHHPFALRFYAPPSSHRLTRLTFL